MNTWSSYAPWAVLLFLELSVLALAQRRVIAAFALRGGWRLAYLYAFPGTVAHELSHLLTAVILRVPVGRVELFRPRRQGDSVRLGVVEVARVGVVRSTLIAIAPVLWIPPLLFLLTWFLMGDWPYGLDSIWRWQSAIWLIAMATLSSAAFPSPGDKIGLGGGIVLVILSVGLYYILQRLGVAPGEFIRTLALVLLPGAISAALLTLVGMTLIRRGRAG